MLRVILGLVAATIVAAGQAQAAECDKTFDSTFALIQAAIFEPRGCTTSICHGSSAAGGLDLRTDVAYDNLLDVPSQTAPELNRVHAGQSKQSLLWLNLAAKTLPDEYDAPLRPMPLDPVPALSEDELEAIRLWIEQGAPRTGVVEGTGELLDACLPPPEPIQIKPLAPPPPGKGVQMRMPRWTLPPVSEDEICMATYVDFSDQVPEQYRGADGTTFRYNFHETRQDPLSHHLVPVNYKGAAAVDSPTWGDWRCRGGERDGELCEPTDTTSCGDGLCATPIVSTVGCLGYGPGDDGIGFTSAGISVTQETANEFPVPPGVYEELPIKGIILWSSHAFNLTAKEGKVESWVNFHFAPPADQISQATNIFVADRIFSMDVPPFQTQEVCNIKTFEENTHVFEWGAHTHRHGKRFRTFRGAFRCQGGPADGEACSPMGYDFTSPDICSGAPCVAYSRRHVGDCNGDDAVTVDEVITSVNIGLGASAVDTCAEADGDRDYRVTVDEVITGVTAALEGVPAPAPIEARDALFYTSTIYNDPTVMRPTAPDVLRGTDDERSVTFCALFDNGHLDPNEVKRRSTSPPPPVNLGGIGGPCQQASHCTAGKVGAACQGRGEANRNRSCDSAPGAGDGHCDACTLTGGVTTEDEMFILLGRYYVP